MRERGTIIWDFDGTLAERPGLWRACLVEVLDKHEPGHAIDPEQIRPFLSQGFPWHTPEVVHPDLNEESWWEHVTALLARAYEGVGLSEHRARTLGHLAVANYLNLSRWRVYEDTIPSLHTLKEDGWKHVILSNHVPELPRIVEGLGLSALIDVTITSAATGYEKPHPEAFALARRAAGEPATIWMVGDSLRADVEGAEAVGIPAILVQREKTQASIAATRVVTTLQEVGEWV
ncbi:MAG TPA: HAD family hydrolase [Herpetosiphonaceae bacterium]|nr:HAD family hydrolase [Herpetosiphonaceae bacterium]